MLIMNNAIINKNLIMHRTILHTLNLNDSENNNNNNTFSYIAPYP